MSQFEPFDFYLLRMPVLPYNQVTDRLRHYSINRPYTISR
jgi:hypothetical protein